MIDKLTEQRFVFSGSILYLHRDRQVHHLAHRKRP